MRAGHTPLRRLGCPGRVFLRFCPFGSAEWAIFRMLLILPPALDRWLVGPGVAAPTPFDQPGPPADHTQPDLPQRGRQQPDQTPWPLLIRRCSARRQWQVRHHLVCGTAHSTSTAISSSQPAHRPYRPVRMAVKAVSISARARPAPAATCSSTWARAMSAGVHAPSRRAGPLMAIELSCSTRKARSRSSASRSRGRHRTSSVRRPPLPGETGVRAATACIADFTLLGNHWSARPGHDRERACGRARGDRHSACPARRTGHLQRCLLQLPAAGAVTGRIAPSGVAGFRQHRATCSGRSRRGFVSAIDAGCRRHRPLPWVGKSDSSNSAGKRPSPGSPGEAEWKYDGCYDPLRVAHGSIDLLAIGGGGSSTDPRRKPCGRLTGAGDYPSACPRTIIRS